MSSKDIVLAAAGGSAEGPLYIEDVFSTYLYTGNGSTQTITNDIDLAGEGGMVWLKSRSAATNNFLFDTNRGALNEINSNTTDAQASLAGSLTSFNSSGFSLGSAAGINVNAATYVSWTFREAPKFFDVVTYTGNGANRTIAHSLGQVPGMIIVKRTDTTGDWQVYHRSNANTQYMVLNTTAAVATGATRWNSTSPTETVFSLGTDATVNASGGTYVAYLFAHDTAADGLIQCGSFSTDGATTTTVTLGWESQYVMVKLENGTDSWYLLDSMRGLTVNVSGASFLQANASSAETTNSSTTVSINATGFTVPTSSNLNNAGQTYIYMAIRRGPMKTPTDGTKVFSPIAYAGNGTANRVISGLTNAPDMVLYTARNASAGQNNHITGTRLQGGGRYLITEDTSAETSSTAYGVQIYGQTSVTLGTATTAEQNASGVNYILYNLRRAPGFFDVVCYTGTGVATTVNHNLGIAPELMITKRRSGADGWQVYSASTGASAYLVLNTTAGAVTGNSNRWNATSPTATVFSIGTAFAAGENYVAYLFASCPGVSKVGSYTGTGATQTISCGFTGGARFVLIKRTDSTGDWYVWDTARGMVSGTDPSLLLNSTAAEVNANSVYTTTGGFQIVSTAAGINASGGSYIYLAIA